MNHLYYGDCLTIMQGMKSASVDLIYLDPPFNSNREYNAIYKDETGRPLPDQIEAFCDLWTLDEQRERALRTMPVLMRENGIADDVVEFWRFWMNALRNTQPRLLAYLSYMVERLLYMKVILKPTGAIYLHCDPTASHYIKVMMDGIFGHENFRNEIVWKRTTSRNDAKRWGAVHDTILFYSKGNTFTWNPLFTPHDPAYVNKFYRHEDEHGRWMSDVIERSQSMGPRPNLSYEFQGYTPKWGWRMKREKLEKLATEGRIIWSRNGKPRLKRYLHEQKGVPVLDVITDINVIAPHARERLGYATQKPLALLDRIITSSSNPDDVVFDPFCGCATTLEAAHRLGRRWIGIDIAIHAIKRVAKLRLQDQLGLVAGRDFVIDGVPRTVEGAKDLWTRDKYHFQKWAVEEIDGFVTTRRTADGGIDGRLYFAVPGARDLQSMAIEVKGGKNVSIRDLRALRGVLDDDTAALAGLIIMEPLGDVQARNFRKFMARAGDMDVSGITYPRMQMLTVQEILDGKRFRTPGVAGRGVAQPELPLDSYRQGG